MYFVFDVGIHLLAISCILFATFVLKVYLCCVYLIAGFYEQVPVRFFLCVWLRGGEKVFFVEVVCLCGFRGGKL